MRKTPKEKADEIVKQYKLLLDLNTEKSKLAALIGLEYTIFACYLDDEKYWLEVKKEISEYE